jgi:putative two-component system response regulator
MVKTIFVVDDSSSNLTMAKTALDSSYRTFALSSAERMFNLVERITPDLILLDLNMPEMDGFEALSILKACPTLKSIPVIFLTASNDVESEIRGFELGAVDFISKPFSPPALLKRIELHIETDKLVKRSIDAVRNTHNATISVIANMVERRDLVTGNHIERTQAYLEILINEVIQSGAYHDITSKWDLSLLLPSAQLHDVGKITISDVILNKPDKLTDDEFDIIKQHCVEGESIIEEIINKINDNDSTFLNYAKVFAKSHHEKWDGTGYPSALKGKEIPLEGRIMALVDVYDALVAGDRPYKKPLPHETAVEIINKERGSHFDPLIVDSFLNVADDFLVETIKNGMMQPAADAH